MTLEVKGNEFETARDAIQHADATGKGRAIQVGGKYLVVEQAEADRLAAAGVEFAYLFDHKMPDGTHRMVTVPVN